MRRLPEISRQFGREEGIALISETLWFKDAVFYELHVKAFCDGNDDGIGDFRGLINKLDYLEWLGVDCLWLLPFFPSPLRDDGYDVADYRQIAPDYGSMEDLRMFLDEAHRRGMRVISDLVLNHTSDQHPWFQEARSSPQSSKRDYYVWSQSNRRYDKARIIFIDTEKSNWTWDPMANAYYWHRFFSHQPDLNYDNPDLQRAMLDTMSFWLEQGLDGFRCDAVPYLFEREGTICENLPETHAYLKEVRKRIDENYRGRILLAEANQWPADVRPYFGDGDECHMAFHFPLMPRLFMGVRSEDWHPIVDMFTHTPPIPENCQWCLFLRNHDELTLEMCAGEERDYMYYAYARDPQMRRNIGIARRLAPLLDNDRRKIELLNSLVFTLPGSPIVYYGDEIGMGDNVHLGDRNGVRTPMQWTADRNGGFSKTDPSKLYLPAITDSVYGFQAINVDSQQQSPHSLLHWMKRMIAGRKKYPAFGRGTIVFLRPQTDKVFAYLREYRGETLLLVHNLAGSAQAVELDLARFEGAIPIEVFGDSRFPTIGKHPYALSLAPYGFYWFKLQRTMGDDFSYGFEESVI
ncbi:maltose alpha-D-glucosyltransferase [Nitrospira japonica]|uniref:maltose alpha-D-glucosyltransferase n=1 Tax=Nitrospira japonica TaxID=1325564 RepID=UPI0009B9FE9A|nr:maltose alpha-D-glucosyltransferase [Nitrospira japonica]